MTDWLLHASWPLLWSRLNTVIIMSSQDIRTLAISQVWGKKMVLNTFHLRNQFILHFEHSMFWLIVNFCVFFLALYCMSLLLWMGLLTTSLFLTTAELYYTSWWHPEPKVSIYKREPKFAHSIVTPFFVFFDDFRDF